jgi:hypothetical protein
VSKHALKTLCIGILLSVLFISARTTVSQNLKTTTKLEQPAEVVEAYAVCREFQHLLAENLAFDRAYEATFVKDVSRRRAIAISDGEFGNQKFEELDSDLLIKAYKLRMQLFYLMLPLANPDDTEAGLFFPAEFKAILKREPAVGKEEFQMYVQQLEQDVAKFRAHLDRLADNYPSVAERVRSFKAEASSAKFDPPTDRIVKTQNEYFGNGQMEKGDPYYEINSYRVVNEDGKMRIVGLRFFTRLF